MSLTPLNKFSTEKASLVINFNRATAIITKPISEGETSKYNDFKIPEKPRKSPSFFLSAP